MTAISGSFVRDSAPEGRSASRDGFTRNHQGPTKCQSERGHSGHAKPGSGVQRKASRTKYEAPKDGIDSVEDSGRRTRCALTRTAYITRHTHRLPTSTILNRWQRGLICPTMRLIVRQYARGATAGWRDPHARERELGICLRKDQHMPDQRKTCPTCDGSGNVPEVLPCPFCGCKPTVRHRRRPWVECESSYCPNPSSGQPLRHNAIEEWNQRGGQE